MSPSLGVKVALAFGGLTLASVGVTGAILLGESVRFEEGQLREREELLAENRAYAIETRIEVFLREIQRLSRKAEIDLHDGTLAPERMLLRAAHSDSTLFSGAVLLVDSAGRAHLSEPSRADLLARDYAQAPWWRSVTKEPGPFAATEGGATPTLYVVAPIHGAGGAFGGAVIGLVDVASLLELATLAHRDDEVEGDTGIASIDRGFLIWRSGKTRALPPKVNEGLAGEARALRIGEDLFAFAPIPRTGLAVVLHYPWERLAREGRSQAWSVFVLLVVGVVIAVGLAFLLARRFTRPVHSLSEQARRITSQLGGGASKERPRDELHALREDIVELEEALAERNRQIAADMERIRSVSAERERLNEELRGLADDLAQRVEARTEELRAAQRALIVHERLATIGKTAAALAHELRNALNGLSVATDLLAQAAGERSSPLVRERAHREIARLRDLTESLLAFQGTPRLARTVEDVHTLLRRSIANFYEDLRDDEVPLELDFDEQAAPLLAEVDAAKIVTVLGNLLRNAIESTLSARRAEDDEDTSPASRPVRIATRRSPSGVEIEISDRGIGLSEEVRARIFEPFFTTKRTGTGIGLASSLRFVEAHGGRLEAKAREGGGATFHVHLPLGAAEGEGLGHGAEGPARLAG